MPPYPHNAILLFSLVSLAFALVSVYLRERDAKLYAATLAVFVAAGAIALRLFYLLGVE